MHTESCQERYVKHTVAARISRCVTLFSSGMLAARDRYQCEGCLQRTLPCRAPGCHDMARGTPGFDEEVITHVVFSFYFIDSVM